MWPQGIEKEKGQRKGDEIKGKWAAKDIYDFLEHCEDASFVLSRIGRHCRDFWK